ncbi:MAG: hypothetical protein AAB505_01740 [Patescibacteria group bacterium]
MASLITPFLFALTIVSFGFLVGIIVHSWRAGQATPNSSSGLAESLVPHLNLVAGGLINQTKRLSVAAYLFLLLVGLRFTNLVKFYLQKIEKRFSFLIETVRGRRQHSLSANPRGAVSFFLEQIKLDQDQTFPRSNRR